MMARNHLSERESVGPEARAVAEHLLAEFVVAGAEIIETDILQPAETLLDLYGEDIRARAYVTADPLHGEMMLRPDFTVPVVQAHMNDGAEPRRYAYMGEVFRRQDHLDGRAREYLQVGYEVFDRQAPEADAEIFALFSRLLADLDLRPVTGDIGILIAAINGLNTILPRKKALLRHIWRPKRFRRLLDRFSGRTSLPEARVDLLKRLKSDRSEALIAAAGPMIGLRSADEVLTRIEALLMDAATPPIGADEARILNELLAFQAPAGAALTSLQDMAAVLPAIMPAIDTFAARLRALSGRGIDIDNLPFEASHGRTSMEYYDGFVFSLHAGGGGPPVASGGRYDALTAVLGRGRSIPAVGGVIRPGLVARQRGRV